MDPLLVIGIVGAALFVACIGVASWALSKVL